MGTKKQKEKKNADFKKVKLKVGKKLKKTSTTDSTIQARKIVLTSQLGEKTDTDDKPLSFRGLSLDELCKQLGHFNKSIRKEALSGTKQLLTSRPDLIVVHLRTLIPSVARLLNESATDPGLNSQLKSLLSVICSVSEQSMSAHFTLLLAHILRALTNMEIGTRVLALSILSIIMTNYPRLCRNSPDLFTSFVKFLASPRKPKWNSPKFLETVLSFLAVYDAATSNSAVRTIEVDLSFEKEHISKRVNLINSMAAQAIGPFDFPVFSSAGGVCASPFELPENLISLSQSLSPLVTHSLLEDQAGAFLQPTLSILEAVGRVSRQQANSFLVPEFKKKLAEQWSQARKAALGRKSDRIRQAVAWLEAVG